ncbi:hypothetical protein ILYODFUR_038952 [Ilyodon furcidens]|uniref:Secreted protein n=1 Tax=Ilyodon furcidens TaxID=33524 RepID=A0ABV0TQG6_9TELE
MIKIIYVWWILFPSTKLAASCYPPSPEPRQKRTLSTFQRKYLNTELTPELTSTPSSAQVNHPDYSASHTWVLTPSTPGHLMAFVYW